MPIKTSPRAVETAKLTWVYSAYGTIDASGQAQLQ